MMIRNEGVLPLLVSLDRDMLVVEKLDITHVADPSLYTSTEEDISVMVEVASEFVENDLWLALFHSSAF